MNGIDEEVARLMYDRGLTRKQAETWQASARGEAHKRIAEREGVTPAVITQRLKAARVKLEAGE